MKAISYSLFYKENQAFDFPSYLRGFMLNMRFARLIYPGWEVILHTTKQTYQKYKSLFDNTPLTIVICEDAELTKAMLWRMKPIFTTENGKWKYSHVLCRDVDSPLTYKEKQAVEYWIKKDKALHAITDSVSHCIPLMGGMIGIRPDYFTERMNTHSWEDLMALGKDINFNIKGGDQTFLNSYVYQQFTQHGNDSITQHYFQGMPNTYLSDFHTCGCSPLASHELRCPNDIEIDIPIEMKESQSCCGHIGASGWYETATNRFLRTHREKYMELLEAEKNFPDIFHWVKDGSL